MEYLNKNLFLAIGCLALSACSEIDDMLPEGGAVTESQVETTTTSIPSRTNADLAGVYTYAGEMVAALSDATIHCDYGYSSICTAMDANASDFVCENSNYNWFSPAFNYTDRSPNYIIPLMRYKFVYTQIKLCNDLIGSIDPNTEVKELQYTLSQVRAVRAFGYLNLAPYFQFNYASSADKPCVPIVSPQTPDPANNPRATVKEVYEFIMDDLNYAVDHLEGFTPSSKMYLNRNVAYGLRARANLYMGKWAEAASDAAEAMKGYTPASIADVSKPAFCNMNEANWMWAIHTETDVISRSLFSPASHLGSFSANAYATGTGVYKCISSFLFNKIPATDVRKGWWVDENLHSANLANCSWPLSNGTAVTGDAIAPLEIPDIKVAFKPYTNVKFGMREGIGSDKNAYDWPLMRVEEMILIQAEGLAMSGQTTQALQVLNDFVKTYRDPSYNFTNTSAEAIQNEIWKQRRIELWGEGFSMADIMRLNKPVVRIHGTDKGNWPAGFDFNVPANDPYLLLRFPQTETNTNRGVTPADNNEGKLPKSGDNAALLDGVTD